MLCLLFAFLSQILVKFSLVATIRMADWDMMLMQFVVFVLFHLRIEWRYSFCLSQDHIFQPKLLTNLPGPASAIAVGDNHSAALCDSQLLSWGPGAWGRLGLGNQDDAFTPTKVESVADVTAVACGGYHTLILTGQSPAFLFSLTGSYPFHLVASFLFLRFWLRVFLRLGQEWPLRYWGSKNVSL